MALKIDLIGKVALITGATRGIGLKTAEVFANAGANLFLTGRDEVKLNEICEELNTLYGVSAKFIAADLNDLASPKLLVRAAYKEFKSIDVLVNNAGQLSDGLIGMFTPEVIAKALHLNLASTLDLTQNVARLMMRKKQGSIINTSSIMGVSGDRGQFIYASAKAGLIGATKSAAKELGPSGIRVNCIAPGYIDTDMTRALTAEQQEGRVSNIALGRAGTAEEVANLTAFLASDLSSFITGQVVVVDGAMTI